jgi:hypothetical protein
LDEFVLLIQCHMADVMMKVALFADVAGLATAVAGLCEGLEGPSAVDIHRDARRECTQRGVIATGVAAEGGCERRKENGVCGGAECVVSEGTE